VAASRDPLVAALEAQHANDKATIARLRADLDDEERMTRGFRRLFIEALRRCRDCPTCNPPTDRSRC
jgi:hypothetical protein